MQQILCMKLLEQKIAKSRTGTIKLYCHIVKDFMKGLSNRFQRLECSSSLFGIFVNIAIIVLNVLK